MRFAADVAHQSARPHEDDRFCIVPIDAADAADAARKVAEVAASRRFGEGGLVGYFTAASRDGWYRATIGEQYPSDDGIALRGVTVTIHVWRVDP